jgi:hypothetical protein
MVVAGASGDDVHVDEGGPLTAAQYDVFCKSESQRLSCIGGREFSHVTVSLAVA